MASLRSLLATLAGAEILAKERQDVILGAVRHGTRLVSGVDLERVRDAIAFEDVVQPAYAPALVGFFGAPGISVSIAAPLPFVSWCALGFGEPVIPWWGGNRWAGRPYWGGWGGPHIVNNVVVNNFSSPGTFTRYQNFGVRNAVVGVDRGRFGRGARTASYSSSAL